MFRSAGLSPDYLDVHIGSTLPAAYAEVSAQTGVPFLYSDEVSARLASYSELSPRDAGGKKAWLMGYLRGRHQTLLSAGSTRGHGVTAGQPVGVESAAAAPGR
jgi:hypothetical protein